MTEPADRFKREFSLEFSDPELLRRAFRHPSVTREKGQGESYQRLEFLGDSILGQVISEHLFRRFPHLEEGRLSQLKAHLVSTPTLSAAGRRLGFSEFVQAEDSLFDKDGEILSDAILEDVFEAVIAAILLDRGRKAARDWTLSVLKEELDRVQAVRIELDPKSLLQQRLLGRFQLLPEYEMLEQSGPPHRRKFLVRCACEGVELGRGSGSSLQAAEQQAAAMALENIEDCYQRIEEALKK